MVLQAADMSYLWLKEIHLENTLGSHSQPLVHSVPWLLANHALVYTHQRHIEVVDRALQAPCLSSAFVGAACIVMLV